MERRHVMRGFHACEICPRPAAHWPPTTIALAGDSHHLGDAEIEVAGHAVTYVAPNMIVHYVTAHHDRPPDEFIVSVMQARSGNSG